MRFSIAQLQAAAKAAGFQGDPPADEQTLRSFVADKIKAGSFTAKLKDGTVITEDQVRGVSATATLDLDESAPDEPAGLDAKVRSLVEAEVRKFKAPAAPPAVGGGGGPDGSESEIPEIKVRSMEEVCYELRGARGQNVFDTFEKAQAFGDALVWELRSCKKLDAPATIVGEKVRAAGQRLVQRGILNKDLTTRAYATYPTASGGALTSAAFMPDIIKLVNAWGVARRLGRVVPMTEAKVNRPKSTGDLTVSYPDENSEGTASGASYSQVTLDAKTGVVLAEVSRQVMQDSIIDVGQDVATDIARSVAKIEDQAFFVGDGTTTYIPGVFGFTNKLVAGTSFGAVLGGADQLSHTLPNLNALMAKLPDFARMGRPVFVCSPAAQARIFDRLAGAVGGLTVAELQGFGYVSLFLRHPIIVSNALNSTDAASNGTFDVLFGDFSMAAMIGDRMGLEIAMDESVGFKKNQIVIRGVIRHDINVHDVGDASNAGPVVGLYQS